MANGKPTLGAVIGENARYLRDHGSEIVDTAAKVVVAGGGAWLAWKIAQPTVTRAAHNAGAFLHAHTPESALKVLEPVAHYIAEHRVEAALATIFLTTGAALYARRRILQTETKGALNLVSEGHESTTQRRIKDATKPRAPIAAVILPDPENKEVMFMRNPDGFGVFAFTWDEEMKAHHVWLCETPESLLSFANPDRQGTTEDRRVDYLGHIKEGHSAKDTLEALRTNYYVSKMLPQIIGGNLFPMREEDRVRANGEIRMLASRFGAQILPITEEGDNKGKFAVNFFKSYSGTTELIDFEDARQINPVGQPWVFDTVEEAKLATRAFHQTQHHLIRAFQNGQLKGDIHEELGFLFDAISRTTTKTLQKSSDEGLMYSLTGAVVANLEGETSLKFKFRDGLVNYLLAKRGIPPVMHDEMTIPLRYTEKREWIF